MSFPAAASTSRTTAFRSPRRSPKSLKPTCSRAARRSRRRARARWPIAAIREACEETGLCLGRKVEKPAKLEGAWKPFAEAGLLPDPSSLFLIARAITPPGRVRRFDTRFFTADASAIAHRVEGVIHADAELVELVWVEIGSKPLADAACHDQERARRTRQAASPPARCATTRRCRSSISTAARCRRTCWGRRAPLSPRHCEERSDEAIQLSVSPRDGLLRFARNDG